MRAFKLSTPLAAGLFSLLLVGCSTSQPNTADLMRSHAVEEQARADLQKRLAADWEKGAELVKEGEKRVRDGKKTVKSAEKELKKGHSMVQKGNSDIARGKKLMTSSERRFEQQFPNAELVNR